MSKRIMNIVLSVFALISGGAIYLMLRKTTVISSVFSNCDEVRIAQNFLQQFRLGFLRYYFADFLWGFSLSTGLIAIWCPKKTGFMACGLIAFAWGCLWEIAQYLGCVAGTGDWGDMAMYFVASSVSVLINFKERKV